MKNTLKISLVLTLLIIFSAAWQQNVSRGDAPISLDYKVEKPEQVILTSADKKRAGVIDSICKVYADRYRFTGNVLVSKKGQPIYKHAFGLKEYYKGDSFDLKTPFQLASVSKQFTAAAIMLLKQDGKISFEDTVQKYLPAFPYERITIRQLLNHTSGLPNYYWLNEHKWQDDSCAPYNHDVVSMLGEHELQLYFRPGSRFDYSNTGYMVLATIVEVVSGELFADFVRKRIFEPLDMQNAFVYSSSLELDYPEITPGFRRWGRYLRKVDNTVNDGAVGDKNVYASVEDLYKWDKALLEGQLFDSIMLDEAFTNGKTRYGREIPYGFGFRLEENDSSKVIYHNGLWNGFRTSFRRHMKDSTTVIILNNTDSKSKSHLLSKIESAL